MSRLIHSLTGMFDNQTYGPQNDFEPRDWQVECMNEYTTSISDKLAAATSPYGNQHRYTVYAGTGSGKTKAGGLLASYLMNRKLVDQVVVVAPTDSVKQKTKRDFVKCFGIEIVDFTKQKHRDGVPRTKQGYILTYNSLMQDPVLHRRICSASPTLVIFDEVHHLGDKPDQKWGDSATEAFGLVDFVVCLTGTPYRHDGTRIPFVEYEETEVNGLVRFKATAPHGYTYSLGRAIADGVCRKPNFNFMSGDVQIRTDITGGYKVVSFDDKADEQTSSQRLRGATRYGSTPRLRMLAQALEVCREDKHKVIIFLGGDTDGEETPTTDARELLPTELHELGISPDEYEIVTGTDKNAQLKIEQFGASDKWILISINMVSEGTDIPELSASIFLTSITAKQTTVQRIGRTLRLRGEDDPHKISQVFMFGDKNFIDISDEIEKEITEEINILKKKREANGSDGAEPTRNRTEAIGIGGGDLVMVSIGGHHFKASEIEWAKDELERRGLPRTHSMAALLLMIEVTSNAV